MGQIQERFDTIDDFEDLELSPLAQEGVAAEDRVYPLGVHADQPRSV